MSVTPLGGSNATLRFVPTVNASKKKETKEKKEGKVFGSRPRPAGKKGYITSKNRVFIPAFVICRAEVVETNPFSSTPCLIF